VLAAPGVRLTIFRLVNVHTEIFVRWRVFDGDTNADAARDLLEDRVTPGFRITLRLEVGLRAFELGARRQKLPVLCHRIGRADGARVIAGLLAIDALPSAAVTSDGEQRSGKRTPYVSEP
jgi:hypothetical protein